MTKNTGHFQKGTGGRPKGAKNKNKITTETRTLLKSLLDNNIDRLQKDLDEMKGYERFSGLMRLSDIVLPKLQRITMETEEGGNMTLNEFMKMPINERLDHIEQMKGKPRKE